jgi:hypothetical protein
VLPSLVPLVDVEVHHIKETNTMSNTLHPSVQLVADNLLRVNIDGLQDDELAEHYQAALDALAELNDFMNSPARKSALELAGSKRLADKLSQQLARMRDIMQARLSAQAMLQQLQSQQAGAAHAPPSGMPSLGRKRRVIRPLDSADNAASGPSKVSGTEPQAQARKPPRGGEAKEAPARPQSDEAGLQAKR